MSKILYSVLLTAYSLLFIHYIKTFVDEEVIEVKYNVDVPSSHYVRIRKSAKRNNRIAEILPFIKPIRFPTDLKYILKHTNKFLPIRNSLYALGQTSFFANKCEYANCFITDNIHMLDDVRQFDAVLFDVKDGCDNYLRPRAPYQKYVFVASDTAGFQFCEELFSDYYNLTWTYKLNSDIKWTSFNILNKKGDVIGPKINMTWIDSMLPTPADVISKISSKMKAVAYFAFDCKPGAAREAVTMEIEKELNKYGHAIDVFGWCANLTCPSNQFDKCLTLLETDYYFYLAFEDDVAEDFVTDQVLYALQHYAVPIVFGGADYSRFLPPGSYIDAKRLNSTQVANEVHKAMTNSNIYADYFKWHNHYEFKKSSQLPDVCKLCQILHEEADHYYSYKNFGLWWNREDLISGFQTPKTFILEK